MSEPTGRTANSTPQPDQTVRSLPLRIAAGIHVQDIPMGTVGTVLECLRIGPLVRFASPINGHQWDRPYTWPEAEKRLRWRVDLDAVGRPPVDAEGSR